MAKKSSSSRSTKSNSNNSIKFMRLTTGEDIVAEVTEVANGKIVLSYPLKIIYTPSLNTGYLSISLMQWVFTKISINQTFDIGLENVLLMTDAEKTLVEHYEDSIFNFFLKSEQYEEEEMPEPDDGIEMLNDLIDQIKGKKRTIN